MKEKLTAREIAEKTWDLWNGYYKCDELSGVEILDIIEKDILTLIKQNDKDK